jgi:hypothetical protein
LAYWSLVGGAFLAVATKGLLGSVQPRPSVIPNACEESGDFSLPSMTQRTCRVVCRNNYISSTFFGAAGKK